MGLAYKVLVGCIGSSHLKVDIYNKVGKALTQCSSIHVVNDLLRNAAGNKIVGYIGSSFLHILVR